MTTSASAVSRIINRAAPFGVRRLCKVMQAGDGSTTVYTMNGTRRQAAALSRARRALLARGYEVATFHGGAVLPLAPHLYYLTVLDKVRYTSAVPTEDRP